MHHHHLLPTAACAALSVYLFMYTLGTPAAEQPEWASVCACLTPQPSSPPLKSLLPARCPSLYLQASWLFASSPLQSLRPSSFIFSHPSGSSTQVAMMVVPFCVLLAWTMGLPLDLDFNGFESFVLFGCVLLAVLVIQVGERGYTGGESGGGGV